PLTDLGGKTCIFSHPVYLFLREFSLQDSRGGSGISSERRLSPPNWIPL
ncbi:conjugal transfer protein, partial [Escherichia coli]|nr:conjugal transfer protein [Escherichia coli]NYX07093.1 conjugal transfer protein [Escherichia coli]NYX37583.1 conjugal transfer protein [Escherichia coli]